MTAACSMSAPVRAEHRLSLGRSLARETTLCGVRLHLCCRERSDWKRLQPLLDRNFYLDQSVGRPSGRAEIHFVRGTPSTQTAPFGSSANPSDGRRVFGGKHCFVELDVHHNRAKLFLREGFWQSSIGEAREALLACFLGLFRSFGVYGLHANAVDARDAGALLVGKSGSGKTTLAAALVESGWRFVSDDAIALRSDGPSVEALALRRSCSMTEATALRFFPDQWLHASPAGAVSRDKRLFDFHARWPHSFRPRCAPSLLLFPEVVDRARTALEPLDSAEALRGLIEESPGILWGGEASSRQMETLSALARNCRSYRVLSGADVLDHPAAVARLIEAT